MDLKFEFMVTLLGMYFGNILLAINFIKKSIYAKIYN